MTVLHEVATRPGEYLLNEGFGTIARDVVSIAANSGDLVAGQVLAKHTSGKHVPFVNGGADGAGKAVAVLYGPVADSAQDQNALATVRLAEVAAEKLTGFAGTAGADLAELFIIVR